MGLLYYKASVWIGKLVARAYVLQWERPTRVKKLLFGEVSFLSCFFIQKDISKKVV